MNEEAYCTELDEWVDVNEPAKKGLLTLLIGSSLLNKEY